MSSRPWREDLFEAARARGIELSPTEIDQICQEKEGAPLAVWFRQEIEGRELLTREEVMILRHLQKFPSRKMMAEGACAHPTASLTEHEILQQTLLLEKSTKSIDFHSDILKKQRAALEVSRSEGSHRASLTNALQRNKQLESQQLELLTNEIASQLNTATEAKRIRLETAIREIPAFFNTRLHNDNRALDQLNESMNSQSDWQIEKSHQLRNRMEKLGDALHRAIVLKLKHRLDRVYEKELNSSHLDRSNLMDEPAEQIQQLGADLQSLYSEIEDVASMLVESTELFELRCTFIQIYRASSEKRYQTFEQAEIQLKRLADNLEELSSRLEILGSHHTMTESIRSHCRDVHKENRPYNHPVVSSQAGYLGPALERLIRQLMPNTDGSSTASTLSNSFATQMTDMQQHLSRDLVTLQREVETTAGRHQTSFARLSNRENGSFQDQQRQVKSTDDDISRAKTGIETLYMQGNA